MGDIRLLDARFIAYGTEEHELSLSKIPDGSNRYALTNSDQDIYGVKIFNSIPKTVLSPTDSSDLVNKFYVDNIVNGTIDSSVLTKIINIKDLADTLITSGYTNGDKIIYVGDNSLKEYIDGTWMDIATAVENTVVITSDNLLRQFKNGEWIEVNTSGLNYIAENVSNKNQPLGYAGLDVDGKIFSSLLPAIITGGTVKVTETDNADYLGNKVDTTTIVIDSNNKLSVKEYLYSSYTHTHNASNIIDFNSRLSEYIDNNILLLANSPNGLVKLNDNGVIPNYLIDNNTGENEGKVKINEYDDMGYLIDKLDSNTFHIVNGRITLVETSDGETPIVESHTHSLNDIVDISIMEDCLLYDTRIIPTINTDIALHPNKLLAVNSSGTGFELVENNENINEEEFYKTYVIDLYRTSSTEQFQSNNLPSGWTTNINKNLLTLEHTMEGWMACRAVVLYDDAPFENADVLPSTNHEIVNTYNEATGFHSKTLITNMGILNLQLVLSLCKRVMRNNFA